MPSEFADFVVDYITKGWITGGRYLAQLAATPGDASEKVYWRQLDEPTAYTIEIYDTGDPDKYGLPNITDNRPIELVQYQRDTDEDYSVTYDPSDPKFITELDAMRRGLRSIYPELWAKPCES